MFYSELRHAVFQGGTYWSVLNNENPDFVRIINTTSSVKEKVRDNVKLTIQTKSDRKL